LFWRATRQPSIEVTLRTYINRVLQPMVDVRREEALHAADDYCAAQAAGARHREAGAWGLLYRSVRCAGHECVAVLRPPALSPATQGPHFRYLWDGKEQRFSYTLEIRQVHA